MKQIIKTNKAPAAIGPYSQAVKVGNTLITSAQLGIDPETGGLADGLLAQVHQAMKNLIAVLEEGGATLQDVVKTTIYVKDMDFFVKVNQIYASYFEGDYPARSCIEAARLPKNALVLIEATAVMDKPEYRTL